MIISEKQIMQLIMQLHAFILSTEHIEDLVCLRIGASYLIKDIYHQQPEELNDLD